MGEFRMPSLGADMEAGTLVTWLKQPGDHVDRGDIIAIVDTDKGAIEIEVFEAGVVEALAVHPGTKVPVGTVLARIDGGAEAAAAGAATGPPPPSSAPPAGPLVASAPPASRRRISPAARKAAEMLGVDLAGLAGTGPGDAVTVQDVERACRPAASPDTGSKMRRAIAAAMTRSKREIPHAYLTNSIDLSACLAWLAAKNARRPIDARLLPAALLLRAVALAAHDTPDINGFVVDGQFERATPIHLGVGIALRTGGLVSPALHDVDQKDVDTVMRELADLVARARGGGLRSSELTDATLTVTNLGDQGVETVLGIIYPPQVALVGFGRIHARPWVVDGRVEPRPVVVASLAVDHRVLDGHRAGLYLAALDRHLQAPEHL